MPETQLAEILQDLRIDVATLTTTVTDLNLRVTEMRAAQVSQDKFSNLEQRVTGLEKWQDWALKIVVGAVIVALLSLVVIQQR